ncbi:MAG: GTP-binding protein [Lachnospiraceae bacterium]|nr:GTP-binding protein [Lachnospiraceae bacterium]
MTKIDIISGFLGAGKTTLIKKLIAEAFNGQKVVLIENEFGEIGIDGSFLKEAGIEITEMNSGCICCSLVGDFKTALKQVIDQYAPDRIVIEPSGVGKLSDVAKAVERVNEDEEAVVINTLATVADGKKTKMYMKNFGEFFNNQIESAGTVILSRTQDMSQDKLDEAIALIREHNSEAVIITTPWDELRGDQILEAMEKGHTLVDSLIEEMKNLPEEEEHHHHHHHHDHDGEEHHHHHDHDEEEHHHHHDHDEEEHHHHHDHDEEEHHHHHDHDEEGHHHHHGHDEEGHHHQHHQDHDADEVFQRWGVAKARKYERGELEDILKKLADEESGEYGIILRAKGMVPDASGQWHEFDLTPGEYEIRESRADYTGRLCVIGSGLKEDKVKVLFGV